MRFAESQPYCPAQTHRASAILAEPTDIRSTVPKMWLSAVAGSEKAELEFKHLNLTETASNYTEVVGQPSDT